MATSDRRPHDNDKDDNHDEFVVTFRATNGGPKCPFANPVVEFTLRPGGCVCLNGKSGLGKTTLAMVLTKSSSSSTSSHSRFLRQTLDIHIDESGTAWHSSIPPNERCGVLFQQTTLLDELTIAGNLQLALSQYYYHSDHNNNNNNRSAPSFHRPRHHPPHNHRSTSSGQDVHYFHDEIKQLMELVGLDYARDAPKRPTELSGGMGRRASLALQLAQHKHVIVLDEPFTGLDYDAAVSVARELVHLRKTQRTALLLISHEPHLAQIVLDPTMDTNNHIITLEEPTRSSSNNNNNNNNNQRPIQPSIFGTTMTHRFLDRLQDYTLYSLPLIVMAFLACGTAIGMLTADLLARLDFAKDILDLVDTHIRPLIKLLTGQEATTLHLMGVRFKVQSLLQQTIPPAKAQLFAIGMTKLMVLEIGPLLTALLLCGRMGGSYAGQVATLHATQQTKLLQTLGVPPLHWTWWPSMGAVLVSSPLLTSVGTAIALGVAGYVGPIHYGIGTMSQYYMDLRATLLPPFRLKVVEWFQNYQSGSVENEGGVSAAWEFVRELRNGGIAPDFVSLFRVTYPVRYYASSRTSTATWIETWIEVLTYPPIYHWTKSIVYGLIILSVAQCVTSIHQDHLTPRGVPRVITLSVVVAGLMVIVADWGFSQLWLLRY